MKGASIPVTEDPSINPLVGVTHNWRYDSQTVANYLEPSMWDGICTTGNRQSPIDVVAADVTQAMACFLSEPLLRKHLTPLEVMASLVAAVCHDVDHPGFNEKFLIARCVGKQSTNENTDTSFAII